MRELLELKGDRDDAEEKWVEHYSSKHQILLLGEGDFSFSCSLATRFGSASNIYASSLDSYDTVVRKYKKARSNLETLKRLGAFLLHGVDATKLQLHPDLHFRRFDCVIFNFPHTGFHRRESDPCQIRKHRELVFGFFHGASRLLRANGEVHVSHKNKAPFCNWNLEELASRCFLVLIQCVAFHKSNYPGYENKRGDGSRCDQPFPLGECSTFKFRFSRVAKELYAEKVKWREVKEREPKCHQAFPTTRAMDNKHVRVEDSSIHLELPRYSKRMKPHRKEQLLEYNRFNRVSLEMHNGKLERMVTRRTVPHQCQEFGVQASQEPFPERSLRFRGVCHGIHKGRVRKMLIRNSTQGESRKRKHE
ncbi:PREDICTED: uncharacterized protein At4g26485 isoform X2 [Camelina sativa]|uniref:Uncharacterized protein At4g26485 isoform X2 n=1 Tax=Camelina sativa TaxID=90675 RepID=A0ABM0X3P6_CAMSA|nr:PREDICTED: uncharacterized protein At4g26485 isoform X2 [Camelina sativa]